MPNILEILKNQGKIDDKKAEEIKTKSLAEGVAVERYLVTKGLVSEVDLAKAKGSAYGIPYCDLSEVSPPADLISKVNADTLKRYKVLPIREENGKVVIAMADPMDVQAIKAIQTALGRDVTACISPVSQIIAQIEKRSREAISSEVSEAVESVSGTVTELEASIEDVSQLQEGLESAPVARIVNTILELAVQLNASDIHIEPQEEDLRIRLRVNGVLVEKLHLPKTLKASIVSRIKIMAKLKIDEKRIPQDGRIPIKSGNRRIDLRVSTIPTIYGEKVVLRLLERTGGVPPLESSGLRGTAYRNYTEAIKKTSGIVLITGPTGSGKTRTLAGTLAKLNNPGVNIVTLEDPVELRISGVNQIQINPDVG